MTHEEKVAHWIGRGARGVEIGPGSSPVPGLEPRPVYVDCFKAFGAEASLADYYGHAGALPFHDHSLDYVVASHVVEHVANPAAALVEWRRVTRPGGIIYLVVPDRRMTFDRTRPLTTVDHLLDDLAAGTTACDPTHIDDFAHGVDWSLFSPGTPPDQITGARETLARGMHEAVARGEDINIHFHTFEPGNLGDFLGTPAAHRRRPLRLGSPGAGGEFSRVVPERHPRGTAGGERLAGAGASRGLPNPHRQRSRRRAPTRRRAFRHLGGANRRARRRALTRPAGFLTELQA